MLGFLRGFRRCDMPDRKAALLARIEEEWQKLLALTEAMPPEIMERPGAVGSWSVKDLLGHIATWEEESLRALKGLLRGEDVPVYPKAAEIRRFNAREVERRRGKTLEEVREEFLQAHRELMAFLEGLPGDLFLPRGDLYRRVKTDTYSHYADHLRDLRRWLGGT